MRGPQFYDTGSIKGNGYYKYIAELTLLVQLFAPVELAHSPTDLDGLHFHDFGHWLST